VGILGGGQLGRMTAEAAHRLGIRTIILDPLGGSSPAGLVSHLAIEGSFKDPVKIRELSGACDIITTEIEHVDTAVLLELEAEGVVVQPSPRSIAIIQDKFAQKQHLVAAGVKVGDFLDTPDVDAAIQAGKLFGYPFMLKSKRQAYDGRGNFVAKSESDVAAGFAVLGGGELYAEKWVPFEKELAVMVVKSAEDLRCYPVVETTQQNNICHTVVAPAMVPGAVQAEARSLALAAIDSLPGCGIFGVEMFALPSGEILLNEIAPRPHNSGHYTMEACAVDQFENHLRAILGLPLGSTDMSCPAALMLNILGKATMEETKEPLRKALSMPNAGIHWYGKAESRPGRKMAHVSFTADSMEAIVAIAHEMGWHELKAPPVVGIIMGSDSDLPTMRAAAEILQEFGVPFEMTIVSAHRTPERLFSYASKARDRGIGVIIAGAGGAAHLPGMVASLTTVPVIGVPVKTSTLSGMDSLYSIVQMPRGIPVATVAIGNAMNAGLLAARMLSLTRPTLAARLAEWTEGQTSTVMAKASRMEQCLAEVTPQTPVSGLKTAIEGYDA